MSVRSKSSLFFPLLMLAALLVGALALPRVAYADTAEDFGSGGFLAFLLSDGSYDASLYLDSYESDDGYGRVVENLESEPSFAVFDCSARKVGYYYYYGGRVSVEIAYSDYEDSSYDNVTGETRFFDWYGDFKFACDTVYVANSLPDYVDGGEAAYSDYVYRVAKSGDSRAVFSSDGSQLFPVVDSGGSDDGGGSGSGDEGGSSSSSSAGGGDDPESGDGGVPDSEPADSADPVAVTISELEGFDLIQIIGDVMTARWISTVLLCLIVGLLVFICFKPAGRM